MPPQNAFLATLDEGQRRKANLDFNEKTRIVWSNLPSGTTMQVGAPSGTASSSANMTPAQEKAALALVATALSREGYQKAMAIVDADQELEVAQRPDSKAGRARSVRPRRVLRQHSGQAVDDRSVDDAIWRSSPRHQRDDRGARRTCWRPRTPARSRRATAWTESSIRPLGDENDRAFELINALNAEQQKQAILGYEVRNLVLGPGTDGKTIAPEGVRASSFTPAQRTMLLALVREWVGILEDQAANAKMKEIESGLNDTYFAWAGPTTNGKGAYFRVQGPAVFIEYAPQGAAENNIDHIHTIYREPANDYAARAARR